MDILELDKKLRTGSPLIDSQHALLVSKINACIDAAQNLASTCESIVLLESISHCLKDHFENEEMLLLEYGLLTRTHLSQHAHALQYLESQITKLKHDNVSGKLTVQGIAFHLYDWAVTHIKSEDSCLAWSHDKMPDIWRSVHDRQSRASQ